MHFFGNCDNRPNWPTCLSGIPDDTPIEEVTKQLQDYTVFTMVRNPYTRAASAYSFLNYVVRSSFITEDAFLDPICHVDWTDFCHNPRVLARHCREHPECCGSEEK